MTQENKKWINEIWSKIENKLSVTSDSCTDKIPFKGSDGCYDDYGTQRIWWWTNGFWPGIMWLMYVATKNEKYKSIAEIAENKLDECFLMHSKLHHDVGFMWHISAGANFKITGNPKSQNRNIMAASILASRYNVNGDYIRAWNDEGTEGWTIIDCMMNLPLLYWATEQTGDKRFNEIAMRHADKAMKYHVRPDGSVAHIVNFNPQDGEFVSYPHTQGYNPEYSTWSRGQAWAIYGYVLSYIHTGKQAYLETAKKCAHYFIASVSQTKNIPLCDFRQPQEPLVLDTSAGAIAACGLIEIANCVPEYEKELYLNSAIELLKALEKEHCSFEQDTEYILKNGTGSYTKDRHVALVYGDYYFIEAIYKLKGFTPLFW